MLAVRRRDLHTVARNSPQLLRDAVAKAFWMLEVRSRHRAAVFSQSRIVNRERVGGRVLGQFSPGGRVAWAKCVVP